MTYAKRKRDRPQCQSLRVMTIVFWKRRKDNWGVVDIQKDEYQMGIESNAEE